MILNEFKVRLKYIDNKFKKEQKNKENNTKQISDKIKGMSKLISGLDSDNEISSKFSKLSKSLSKTEIINIPQIETLLESAMDETLKSQSEIIKNVSFNNW